MTVSKRVVRQMDAPPRRHKLRTARLVVFKRSHLELSMSGFELEDLDALKDAFAMRWDKEDRCWLLARRDLDELIDYLERAGFIVRMVRGVENQWD